MKLKQKLAIGALVAWPCIALAQSQGQPNPVAATEHVPAVTYVSAFKNYQSATDSQTSPEQAWRAANETVGKLGGHAGHIKGNADATNSAKPATAAEVSRPSSRSTAMPMKHGHHHH